MSPKQPETPTPNQIPNPEPVQNAGQPTLEVNSAPLVNSIPVGQSVPPVSQPGQVNPPGQAGVPVSPIPAGPGMGGNALSMPVNKKSKTPLIIGIIAAVLLVVFGGLGAFAYTQYQKPENVLLDAISKMPSREKVYASATITSDYENKSYGVKFKKFVIGAGAEYKPRFDANAEAVLELNGKEISVKGSAILDSDGTIYFRIDNVVDALKAAFEELIPTEVEKKLRELENRWVKYTLSDMREDESGKKAADQVQCLLDVYKNYGKDSESQREQINAYKENPYILVKEEVQSKDGNFGYNIKIDKEKAKAWSKRMKDTKFIKEVESCSDTFSSFYDEDSTTSVDNSDISFTIWVSKWGHDLKSIEAKYVAEGLTDTNEKKEYTTNVKVDFDYSKGSTVEIPKDAMSGKTWMEKLEEAYSTSVGGGYDDYDYDY